MALIKCPECGQEISDTAKTCPNCGYPIQKKEKHISIKAIEIVVVIAFLFFGSILLILSNKLNDTEQKEVDYVIITISNIGEINIESESKIAEAEKLYDDLSKKCQRHVTNHKELLEARKIYNDYKAKETSDIINRIGEITLDSRMIIDEAQKSYDALSEEQKKLVKNYEYLMSAIKKITDLEIEDTKSKISAIEIITIESGDKISEARESYDKLTDDEKSQIDNYDNLKNAENEYEQLVVNNCISLIDSIGTVTLESKSKIDESQKLYNNLSKEAKEKVTNYLTLTNANSEYKKLEKEEEDRKKTLNLGDSFSTSKWEVIYKKTNITAKILPNNTSGYYMYYYADDDETFVDIIFQIKNVNTDILGIEDIIGNCEVVYDGSTLTKNYSLYTSSGSHIDKVYMWDGLDALDSTTLHVAINMPRELQTNDKSLIVNLVIAGEEKIIIVR